MCKKKTKESTTNVEKVEAEAVCNSLSDSIHICVVTCTVNVELANRYHLRREAMRQNRFLDIFKSIENSVSS